MEKYAARLSPFLTKLSGFSVHGGVCTIGGQQMNWLPHNEIYFASVQLFPLIYPAFVEFFPKINTEVSRVDICHFSFLFVNIFLSSIQSTHGFGFRIWKECRLEYFFLKWRQRCILFFNNNLEANFLRCYDVTGE